MILKTVQLGIKTKYIFKKLILFIQEEHIKLIKSGS